MNFPSPRAYYIFLINHSIATNYGNLSLSKINLLSTSNTYFVYKFQVSIIVYVNINKTHVNIAWSLEWNISWKVLNENLWILMHVSVILCIIIYYNFTRFNTYTDEQYLENEVINYLFIYFTVKWIFFWLFNKWKWFSNFFIMYIFCK